MNTFKDIVRSYGLHFSNPKASGILRSRKLIIMRLARIDNTYVGCACSSHKYSCMVFVKPFYRNRGIGTQLIEGMNTKRVDSREILRNFWNVNNRTEKTSKHTTNTN